MAAFVDPFDSLLIADMNIYAPPAADSSGQKIFDPANPGSPAATVKARRSMTGRTREFKSDKKTVISNEKIFMRPFAGLTEKHTLEIAGAFYNILGIDDPGGMGHHFEIYVEVING
jgi:hypothetical protein